MPFYSNSENVLGWRAVFSGIVCFNNMNAAPKPPPQLYSSGLKEPLNKHE
jgi:hypothetical protein